MLTGNEFICLLEFLKRPRVTTHHEGNSSVVNAADSPYGNGWMPEWLDELSVSSAGALLKRGDGNTAWFKQGTGGSYIRPSGEYGYSELTAVSGGYQLTDKYGLVSMFDTAGKLLSRTDRNGNQTAFVYDSQGRVQTMTDPFGRVTTVAYNGTTGLMNKVTDFAGRETLFQHDSSRRLTTITHPDTNLGDANPASQTTLTYDGSSSRVKTLARPGSSAIEYFYDSFGRLTSIKNANGTFQYLDAVQSQSLVDTSGGVGATSTNPAALLAKDDVVGKRTNELTQETQFKTDRFGFRTWEKDAAGNITEYERNADGLVERMIGPYREIDGSAGADETVYTYDTQGNLLTLTEPSGALHQWQYGVFSQMSQYIDPTGRVTKYTLSAQGNVTKEVRIVGLEDGVGNTQTNDITTNFTYTTAGLVDTVTDARAIVTDFDYSSTRADLISKVTYAKGTSAQADVVYTYDTATDYLLSFENELDVTWEYAYDDAGQLDTVWAPNPTGTGHFVYAQYEYTSMGRVKSETDALGRETTYTYGAFGKLYTSTLIDPTAVLAPAVTSYDYDDAGNLISVTDPLGNITLIGWDAAGRQTSIALPDPDGTSGRPTTTFGYDAQGRLISETNPLNHTTNIQYSYTTVSGDKQTWVNVYQPNPDGTTAPLGRPRWETRYNGAGEVNRTLDAQTRNATAYGYSSLGQRDRVSLPDPDGAGGPLTSFAELAVYDKTGNLIKFTDGTGQVTDYEYDERNRLIRVLQDDPDGVGVGQPRPETTYAYDDAGQLLTVIDPLLRVTSYEYDNLGRITKVTLPDPDGNPAIGLAAPEFDYTYDLVGNLATESDLAGNTTSYVYDAHNNLRQVTEPDPDGSGLLTSPISYYGYDANDRLITVQDPLNRVTYYDYDNTGRLERVTLPDPDGAGSQVAPYTAYTYDAAGNVLTESNALGETNTFTYDPLNRVKTMTDDEGGLTSFEYDANSDRVALVDPEGNRTEWTYDRLQRMTGETIFDGTTPLTKTFLHNKANNVEKVTDRNGRVTEYQYDKLQRVTGEVWKTGSTTNRTLSFTYDVAGQMLSAIDPDLEHTFTYDALGRTTRTVNNLATLDVDIRVEQVFDQVGNRTQLKSNFGGYWDFLNAYSYDNLGRMTSVQQKRGSSGSQASNVDQKRVDFSYDAASQLDTIKRYSDVTTNNLVATSDYDYDGTGRLTGLSHVQGSAGTAYADYSWTYDAANRITGFANTVHPTENVTYAYDGTGQITGADRSNPLDDEAYVYDDNGNRETANGSSYTTGDNNRLESDGTYTYEYDNEGNRTSKEHIASGEREEYTWDHRNRLTKVTFKNSAGTITKTVDNQYDTFNRWVGKTVDPDGATGSTALKQTSFIYDGNQIILEFNDPTRFDLVNRYLWGPMVDQLLAVEEVDDILQPGDTLWTLGDNFGSIRDVIDDAGTLLDHTDYDSFGNATAALDLLFGYTGRAMDEDTGLQNNLHRWYDSETGRWLSEDPIGFLAGDPNLYRYVGNAATNHVDPTGEVIPIVIGGGIAIGVWLFGPSEVAHAPRNDADIANIPAIEAAQSQENVASTIGWITAPIGGRAYQCASRMGTTFVGRGLYGGMAGGAAHQFSSDLAIEPFNPGSGVGGYFSDPWGSAANYGSSMAGWTGLGIAGEAIAGAPKPTTLLDDFMNTHVRRGATSNPPGTYRPSAPLPRGPNGEFRPSSTCPHTQIGTEVGRRVGPYTAAREFGPNGRPIRDIHFTDHGRPNVPGHTNPHQHPHVPNPTGGTPIYGDAEPFTP